MLVDYELDLYLNRLPDLMGSTSLADFHQGFECCRACDLVDLLLFQHGTLLEYTMRSNFCGVYLALMCCSMPWWHCEGRFRKIITESL